MTSQKDWNTLLCLSFFSVFLKQQLHTCSCHFNVWKLSMCPGDMMNSVSREDLAKEWRISLFCSGPWIRWGTVWRWIWSLQWMALQETSCNLLFKNLAVQTFWNNFTKMESWELFPVCFQGSPRAWAVGAPISVKPEDSNCSPNCMPHGRVRLIPGAAQC